MDEGTPTLVWNEQEITEVEKDKYHYFCPPEAKLNVDQFNNYEVWGKDRYFNENAYGNICKWTARLQSLIMDHYELIGIFVSALCWYNYYKLALEIQRVIIYAYIFCRLIFREIVGQIQF